MSVLIKGMEMPSDCHNCPLGFGGGCYCGTSADEYMCPDHGRADWCPLVPVPPHGRLIDADELAATCDEPHWCAWLSDIDNAPTIIPAEPPKDDAPIGPYDLLYEEGGYGSSGV